MATIFRTVILNIWNQKHKAQFKLKFVNIPKKIKRIDIRISFTLSAVIFSARKI